MNWIWSEQEELNSYIEFTKEFTYEKGKAELFISADYKYEAYINGKFVSNCQYADIPEKKSVDSVDIAGVLQQGKNVLLVKAFHMGVEFSSCRAQTAGIAFQIVNEGKILAQSDENTLCRKTQGYLPGDMISGQLGFGWKFDFTDLGEAWQKAKAVHTGAQEIPRPIPNLVIGEEVPSIVCAHGIYRYNEEGTFARKMQTAWLSNMRFADMTGKNRLLSSQIKESLTFKAKGGDGIYIIVDLQQETSGYLTFSLTTKKSCKGGIGWGEHLADLRIRTERDGRNFASEYTFKEGKNEFEGYIHRLGCRYLCLFIETDEVEVEKFTLKEAVYPFSMPEKDFGDRLLNKIYDVGRRTLVLCAHEHYEDCPWREQALYGMDGRNQMLFGYGAFGEYRLPRAALRLQAYSTREDGFLTLCAPCRSSICIPSFSLYWTIAVYENALRDYDDEFVKEMLPYAEKLLSTFQSNTDERGVCCFKETPYWNFYEWSDGLDGCPFNRTYEIPVTADAISTALTYLAAKGIALLEEKVGKKDKAEDLNAYAAALYEKAENFFDEESGLYASYIEENGNKKGYHAYTQAAMLWAGFVPEERKARLCSVLKNPEGVVVDMTFAALQLKYDAIIECDGNPNWCIDDICQKFGGMIFKGATSYWETENGEADFEDAGSLCHGWSSVVCYVFDKYLKTR